MTKMEKTIYILLCILTLGIYPYLLRKNARKQSEVKSELSTAKKVITNATKMTELLGGSENILNIEYTHTKIKVIFKSKERVNIEAIKDLKGVSGIFATSKQVSIIVGNQAKKLAEML